MDILKQCTVYLIEKWIVFTINQEFTPITLINQESTPITFDPLRKILFELELFRFFDYASILSVAIIILQVLLYIHVRWDKESSLSTSEDEDNRTYYLSRFLIRLSMGLISTIRCYDIVRRNFSLDINPITYAILLCEAFMFFIDCYRLFKLFVGKHMFDSEKEEKLLGEAWNNDTLTIYVTVLCGVLYALLYTYYSVDGFGLFKFIFTIFRLNHLDDLAINYVLC